MNTIAVILAAGKGTRMKSEKPKVLHTIAGDTLLGHVVNGLEGLCSAKPVVVIGHKGEEIIEAFGEKVDYVWQREQLGTGHAVIQAIEHIKKADEVLVLCGDTPLMRKETIEGLLDYHRGEKAKATVLTVDLRNPAGYGRIIRDAAGALEKIVEQKDGTEEELMVKEINSGAYCFEGKSLAMMLDRITPSNAQKEYYLTDVIELLKLEGEKVLAYKIEDEAEILGVNSRVQLAEAGRILRKRINEKWMEAGVTIIDPENTYIDSSVNLSQDCVIWPGAIIEGSTQIGEGTVIGPNCRIVNSKIGAFCKLDYCTVLDSSMGDNCPIGPYAYIRPGCVLDNSVKIGDFVEIKKTSIGEGSKLPHHSYVGDAEVGKKVNIGAGTITCNYDGKNKFKTIIGDNAFIGSNSNLVAPVKIDKGAYVAAGSTITQDIPEDSLGVARGRQRNIEGWSKKNR